MEKQVRDLQLVIVKIRGNRTTTPTIVGLTMLGVVASVLPVVCKRMQQLPTMLGPVVHRGKDTTHKTLETMGYARAWPQHCCKSCANGFNIVAQRFGDHGTKEMLGVVGSNFWPVSNATGCANRRNVQHPIVLGVVGQQCYVHLHGAFFTLPWFGVWFTFFCEHSVIVGHDIGEGSETSWSISHQRLASISPKVGDVLCRYAGSCYWKGEEAAET